MNPDNGLIDIIFKLLTLLSPITVAYIGYKQVIRDKESKRNKKLQEELEKKKQEEEEERLGKIEKATLENTVTLKEVQKSVARIEKVNLTQQTDILKLAKMTSINMDYIRSNSNVVSALAEGLRDNNIDGNVTRAVESCREFESRQMQTMVEMLTPHDKNGQQDDA